MKTLIYLLSGVITAATILIGIPMWVHAMDVIKRFWGW
jgi:hypothetical protein